MYFKATYLFAIGDNKYIESFPLVFVIKAQSVRSGIAWDPNPAESILKNPSKMFPK
jgi:hypothetical protein